jgi:hypothetical protein
MAGGAGGTRFDHGPGMIYINASPLVAVSTLPNRTKRKQGMSATDIAKIHFSAAIADAERAGLDCDGVCRALLGLVVAKYLESRAVSDVQSELRFVADNCDPDTDFMFMRP